MELRTKSDINNLIDRIKEHNTRQQIASEQNEPLLEQIDELIKVISQSDLESKHVVKFKDSIIASLKSVDEFLAVAKNGDDVSYNDKIELQRRVSRELADCVSLIYDYWEGILDENFL